MRSGPVNHLGLRLVILMLAIGASDAHGQAASEQQERAALLLDGMLTRQEQQYQASIRELDATDEADIQRAVTKLESAQSRDQLVVRQAQRIVRRASGPAEVQEAIRLLRERADAANDDAAEARDLATNTTSLVANFSRAISAGLDPSRDGEAQASMRRRQTIGEQLAEGHAMRADLLNEIADDLEAALQ